MALDGVDGIDGVRWLLQRHVLPATPDTKRAPIYAAYVTSVHSNMVQLVVLRAMQVLELVVLECHSNEGFVDFIETGAVNP